MSLKLSSKRRPLSRSGVTTVEFAMTLPILITVFVGMIEFTRLSNMRHAADNASYAAARMVMVPGANAAEAVAEANDLLARVGLSNATIVVTPSPILETTTQVAVQVDVPLLSNSWLPPVWTRNITVSRSTTLMTERVPVIQSEGIPDPPVVEPPVVEPPIEEPPAEEPPAEEPPAEEPPAEEPPAEEPPAEEPPAEEPPAEEPPAEEPPAEEPPAEEPPAEEPPAEEPPAEEPPAEEPPAEEPPAEEPPAEEPGDDPPGDDPPPFIL